MLIHPTIDKLESLRLGGMVVALKEQQNMDLGDLSFEERLGLLVDREAVERDNRRLKTRLRQARLRHQACIENINFKHPRGLDKSLIMRLAECSWLQHHQNMIITGPTGAGKSYLACAFAQKACRSGYTANYQRVPRFFEEINLARGDGRYVKLMAGLAKVDLLILDDFGLQPLSREQRHDLLEILEDRHQLRSTLVTSQLPHEHWHEQIGDPTLADAILDRLIHNAHIIQLKPEGGSMRKAKANLTALNREG